MVVCYAFGEGGAITNGGEGGVLDDGWLERDAPKVGGRVVRAGEDDVAFV